MNAWHRYRLFSFRVAKGNPHETNRCPDPSPRPGRRVALTGASARPGYLKNQTPNRKIPPETAEGALPLPEETSESSGKSPTKSRQAAGKSSKKIRKAATQATQKRQPPHETHVLDPFSVFPQSSSNSCAFSFYNAAQQCPYPLARDSALTKFNLSSVPVAWERFTALATRACNATSPSRFSPAPSPPTKTASV